MPLDLVPSSLPRENTTSLGQVPFDVLYGKEEVDRVVATYERDFRWFGYSTDPSISVPVSRVDLESVIKEGREADHDILSTNSDDVVDAATS